MNVFLPASLHLPPWRGRSPASPLLNAFLRFCVACLVGLGFSLLFLGGYGVFWGPRGRRPREFLAMHGEFVMDGFHAGLIGCPLLASLLMSVIKGQAAIFVLTLLLLGVPCALLHFRRLNLFIPVICTLALLVALVLGSLRRMSIIVILFFLYLTVISLPVVFLFWFFAPP